MFTPVNPYIKVGFKGGQNYIGMFSWRSVSSDTFVRRKLKSACASAQSDQSLRRPHEKNYASLGIHNASSEESDLDCTKALIVLISLLGAHVRITVKKGTFSDPLTFAQHTLIFSGANTIVPSIWGNEAGKYMQALYLSYTIAGITCPLLTRPFMTSHLTAHTDFDQENPDISLMTAFTRTTVVSTTVQKSLSYNVSTEDYNHLNNTLSEGRKSVIYLAFVVTGVLTLSSAIPYFIMTFFSKHKVWR